MAARKQQSGGISIFNFLLVSARRYSIPAAIPNGLRTVEEAVSILFSWLTDSESGYLYCNEEEEMELH